MIRCIISYRYRSGLTEPGCNRNVRAFFRNNLKKEGISRSTVGQNMFNLYVRLISIIKDKDVSINVYLNQVLQQSLQ